MSAVAMVPSNSRPVIRAWRDILLVGLGLFVFGQQVLPALTAWAQGAAEPAALANTSFTFQGRLLDDGVPAEGAYDFEFALFEQDAGGTAVATLPGPLANVAVANGLFTVTLNFGDVPFANGAERWLEVRSRPAGQGAFTTFSQRQLLAATPYAVYAGSGGSSAPAWDLTGNAGTVPGTNFIGTTDNVPLEFRVNNVPALELTADGNTAVSVIEGQDNSAPGGANAIGGGQNNVILPGVFFGTIGGGGDTSGQSNRVTDDFGTIAGGSDNRAGDQDGTTSDHPYATVAGGHINSASTGLSFIGGGEFNLISGSGFAGVIGGGENNQVVGGAGTVGGGESNLVIGHRGVIAGGESNIVFDGFGTVGGGDDNSVGDANPNINSQFGTVSGGTGNMAIGNYSTVPGGHDNQAAGDYSFAAGRRASATTAGSFVWADSTNADFLSTNPNSFVVRAFGGVGLGTGSPTNQLHVTESINLDASPQNHVTRIQNTSTGNSADVLALSIGFTGNPLSSNNFITFFKDDDVSVGAIEGNGAGGVVLAGPGADFAEWLPKMDPAAQLAAGDIVGVFGNRLSHETDGADRVMVVSTGPIVAGNDPGEGQRAHYAQVAFVGQVPVRVNSPVAAGDYILASGNNDGRARSVSPAELRREDVALVVGKALAAAPAGGEVQVMVGDAAGQAMADLLAAEATPRSGPFGSTLFVLAISLLALATAAGVFAGLRTGSKLAVC